MHIIAHHRISHTACQTFQEILYIEDKEKGYHSFYMYSELLISDPNLDKLSPLLQLSVWHNQKFLNTGVLAQAVALAWSAVGPAKMLSILSGKRRKVWLPFSKLLEHLGVGSNRSNNFRKM